MYQLFCDKSFVEERLQILDATAREILSHDVSDDKLEVSVRTAMSRDKLPKKVRGFVRGEPTITRTESWRPSESGFMGESDVKMSGPGAIKGRMALEDTGEGSSLTVHFDIEVPIPMFGGEVEQILVSEISETMNVEAKFTEQSVADRSS
ncbi:hypothetical protein ASG69_11140 [Rhodococcus sp. Leaf225]|nr:hypothetical protein ASG69_11140 [Rhodococcus sp. Leaf225]KQU47541.1 hypothetical protein ASH03_21840 [Rhodococcus sp. Leaf258]